MPLRPSIQNVGSTVGKRLFGTSNASVIKRKIAHLDQDALKASLRAHGVRNMDARRMTNLLTGEGRVGSMSQVRGATNALKELGVVQERATTGQIMYESAKRAGQDELYKQTGSLRPNALSLGRSNASLGSRVAEARMNRETQAMDEHTPELEQARTIGQVRETLRKLGIKDRIIAKKLDDPAASLPMDW